MSKIEVLPHDVAERIAAGEVVERPASIVKELLENALDAGASSITIGIEKGGCESIRVVDNGRGIEAADVPLAFERHATSKIRVFDDLFRLKTFGFRGEALASIAAVARVEMVSRTGSSPSAVSYTHLRAHETVLDLVCRLLLEKKKTHTQHRIA